STERYPFLHGVYRSFAIPAGLVKNILLRSMPLLVNELMWGAGQAVLLQCYSVRGIQAVAALNICNTIAQIFNEVFLSLGNATAIVVGQELGADRLTGARRTAWRMITLSLTGCVVMGTLLAICAPYIPRIYNTEESIRMLATELICMAALCMPLYGFANCEYFTLRSGGKTFITFLFDSCFTWVVSVPMAYCLSRFTSLNIVMIYLFVNGMDSIKCAIGFVLVKKGVWVRNIVKD
ncbi:MATE family efflux transporter, partial [Gemmiger sp.]